MLLMHLLVDLNASAEGKELLNNISRATNLVDIDNACLMLILLYYFKQSDKKARTLATIAT